MDRPPFRFAVQATDATGEREWRDTARKVEDLGYSTLFLADHYLGQGPAQRAARTRRQDLAPFAARDADGLDPQSADLLRNHPDVLIGSPESVGELLRSRRESLGVNYVTVQQSQIESFAPVVALLHGR
jgi:alkanesulfonate monooxygenase SsuD/methylene tetrahydromethanopterin reductase-like flavin-dependent oxidoreductase (luciferase family)